MEESIVGLRVKIEIDDDGSSNPPILPPGTIVRSITGPDREKYYLVHLDNPIRSKHVKTGKDWILNNLAIAPNFKGGSLRSIITTVDDYVAVGIVNMFTLPSPDDPLLDFSKGEYFATGRVRRAM
jgi:hypothetical protein